MRILITGATGFIGKKLCLKLFREGHDLVVLARKPEAARAALGLPAEVYGWDYSDHPPPSEALVGIESLLNLAGEPVADHAWNAETKRRIHDSRVVSTRSLLKALREVSPTSLKAAVNASAIGYYGDRGDEELDEGSESGTDFLARVCQDWESALRENAPLSARQVVIRIGIVLGREGGALPKLLPLFRTGLGGPIGSGRQWMSWIHIDDLVDLFAAAATDPSYVGTYNGVAPRPVTNSDFSRELGHALGKPAVFKAPKLALRAALGERANVVLASQKVFPRALESQSKAKFRYSGIQEAFADLCRAPDGSTDEVFRATQWVPQSVDEVWPFFREARNLEEITPSFLNFKILKQSTSEVGEGTLIDYKLKIHGVPIRWKSRIESWNPPRQFSDVQLKGPYSKWHHTHRFEPLRGGTLLQDEVVFRLPLGVLGGVVAGTKVRRDVQEIFAYRSKVVGEKFGQRPKDC